MGREILRKSEMMETHLQETDEMLLVKLRKITFVLEDLHQARIHDKYEKTERFLMMRKLSELTKMVLLESILMMKLQHSVVLLV